ncbi:MAG TPA: ATP-dependent DNA helicase [bacterium]
MSAPTAPTAASGDVGRLIDDLTDAQRDAVTHDGVPLLIVAGAGTGKTTVIARRIAWLLASGRARQEEILGLTFSEKAAREMEERVDLLVPYGYLDVTLRTFHAFGDQLIREHAHRVGLTPQCRVLSKAEQLVFLRERLFHLPLEQFRPLHDPAKFLDALATVFARAKDETVTPEEFSSYARTLQADPAAASEARARAQRTAELAAGYAEYQRLLREADALDFGDQVLLAIELLERHPDVLAEARRRYRYILVDEFQDTNYAQFRLLTLLAEPGIQATVVADDDQSIYKWRGAALSNVLQFLERYGDTRTIVLKDNFRSPQALLDHAYRLIRHNDPDRLEVRQGIDKRLHSRVPDGRDPVHLQVFDTVSSESDWVSQTIRGIIESGRARAGDVAVLVRANREAELFLRALNVAGIPWTFSGASGLFARPESKMLLSCIRALADAEDSLSWYHVASSDLYRVPMRDLAAALAAARRRKVGLAAVLESPDELALSEAARGRFEELLRDVEELREMARERTCGQVLYEWLSRRGLLAALSREERLDDVARLKTLGRFFRELRRIEDLGAGGLMELMRHLALFEALGSEPMEEDDAWADRVHVLTVHKAKGLEFPVVFMVGLVQGRFPSVTRRDPIELPEALIKDILPSGNYHLQEERRLFYVGMTRAKEELFLSCAYNYGGKSTRKISQFAAEALDLPSPSPQARVASARQLIEQSAPPPEPVPLTLAEPRTRPLRLDAHGADDYRTCPLKYRFSHVLHVPVMRHHPVIYGTAIHKAIEVYFRRVLQGSPMPCSELLEAFQAAWKSEGFFTREHEALRLEQGQRTLRRFYERQQERPERPALIEERFRFPLPENVIVVGRWDRVDVHGDQAVIIDYKSSEVREQAAADRQAKQSFQLAVYALAWKRLRGGPPARVELRFLESELTGTHEITASDLESAERQLLEVAGGIRDRKFPARPQEFSCRWCAFQSVCPYAFQTPGT